MLCHRLGYCKQRCPGITIANQCLVYTAGSVSPSTPLTGSTGLMCNYRSTLYRSRHIQKGSYMTKYWHRKYLSNNQPLEYGYGWAVHCTDQYVTMH